MGVFVVGGLKEFGGPFWADEDAGGQDFGRVAGGGQACGYLGFDGINQQAAADGGAWSDRGGQAVDVDHGVTHRCAGIENDRGEIHQFFPLWMAASAGFGVGSRDEADDFYVAALEFGRHFHGNDVAPTGGDDESAVGRLQGEVAEDAGGQPADVFEKHGLSLAIGADDEVVKCEREFDDGIEPGKRAIAGPHFFDHDARVPGSKHVDHAAGQNGGGEEVGGLGDQWQLRFDRVDEVAGFFKIAGGRGR